MSDYVKFYRGELTTPQDGFSIHDVLRFSDEELEDKHMYVQWVFPNPTLSKLQPSAARQPLTEDAALELKRDTTASNRALQMVIRMLEFWGMDITDEGYVRIFNEDRFAAKLQKPDHNQQRMTRMLIFLKCMGWMDLMEAIREVLIENVPLSARAVQFWADV